MIICFGYMAFGLWFARLFGCGFHAWYHTADFHVKQPWNCLPQLFFFFSFQCLTHFHALATCFLSLVQLSCCFIFECRIHVTDDDVVHWKQNNVTPTLTIDSMRDLLRVFINGQVAGSYTRLLHTFCTWLKLSYILIASLAKLKLVVVLVYNALTYMPDICIVDN